MKALVDADLFVYRLSSAYDNKYYRYRGVEYEYIGDIHKLYPDADRGAIEEGKNPEGEEKVIKSTRKYMEEQLDVLSGLSIQLYLSGGANFRYKLGTIKNYKANRSKDKPVHFDLIKQLLVDDYGAICSSGIECDDLIAYNTRPYEDLIYTVDKDFMQIPGYLLNFVTRECKEVGKLDALRYFYTQVYVGDSTDNIPGLYGAGATSTLVKRLYSMSTEEEMFNAVREDYKSRYWNYADKFLQENLQLLWLTTKEEHWPMWIHEYGLSSFYKGLKP